MIGGSIIALNVDGMFVPTALKISKILTQRNIELVSNSVKLATLSNILTGKEHSNSPVRRLDAMLADWSTSKNTEFGLVAIAILTCALIVTMEMDQKM